MDALCYVVKFMMTFRRSPSLKFVAQGIVLLLQVNGWTKDVFTYCVLCK